MVNSSNYVESCLKEQIDSTLFMQQLECTTKPSLAPFCCTFMTGERNVKVIYRLEYGNNQLFARAAPYCPVAPPGAADTLVINYDPV